MLGYSLENEKKNLQEWGKDFIIFAGWCFQLQLSVNTNGKISSATGWAVSLEAVWFMQAVWSMYKKTWERSWSWQPLCKRLVPCPALTTEQQHCRKEPRARYSALDAVITLVIEEYKHRIARKGSSAADRDWVITSRRENIIMRQPVEAKRTSSVLQPHTYRCSSSLFMRHWHGVSWLRMSCPLRVFSTDNGQPGILGACNNHL